jgi:ATP-dependent protease ClpP protease subunit
MIWKTNIDNKIEKVDLRKNPVIITVNKFDEESAKKFRGDMNAAINSGQNVIPIIIDSYGGQVYSLMSMVSMIKACPVPVATIIQGKAMSCGIALATFGDEGMRYMDPDATAMIHEVSSSTFGKNEEIQADAKETERLNEKLLTMMSRNCGHADDYFSKIIHEKGHADWFLDAKETLKHQIVNHLKIPVLNIDVKVSIGLE